MKSEKRTMKKLQWILLATCLWIGHTSVFAQQYTGMSGLIHVPTAEMDETGEARIGIHFLNKNFTPDSFSNREGKYHTFSHYLSITPFSWIEIGYTCTLQKDIQNYGYKGETKMGYYFKDRYFSLKLQPLKEKTDRWWPSIAIGTNDPIGSNNYKTINGKERNMHFSNFYLAATKHFDFKVGELGLHAAYRKWKRDYNAKWNGVVGGITYRPAFFPKLRAVAEYTGDDVNIGADCLLLKYFLLQATLQNGKYFSGGICLQVNLF